MDSCHHSLCEHLNLNCLILVTHILKTHTQRRRSNLSINFAMSNLLERATFPIDKTLPLTSP